MKFQVGKLAALATNMQEYLRVLNLSVNSAGSTDNQIAYQLDTISRKATTVKADIEELFMGIGQSGLSSYIKEWLNDTHNFITGLQQIPQEVWSVTGSFAKWSVLLYGVKTALTFLTNSMVSLRSDQSSQCSNNYCRNSCFNCGRNSGGQKRPGAWRL